MLALLVASYNILALAQSPSQTTLIVGLQNVVEYQGDIGDPQQFAANPGITTSVLPKNFGVVTIFGDIVAVNGQPARGLYVGRSRQIGASPTPRPGNAIADVTRTAMREHYFEILQSDGTPVGTIMSLGFSGGPAPPGAPSTERANWAIVGGTGAFFGARGVVGGTGVSGRAASMTEDPSNRRINGGTTLSFILHLIPMETPQILNLGEIRIPEVRLPFAGPAVFHSDFSQVTAAKPAHAGEILISLATGMGPTRPGVDPGQPFPTWPANPLQQINSPVNVTVNGQSADVINAIGWPGLVAEYRVDFRVPDGTASGLMAVQLSAAWIQGPAVNIPIQ